ncbi:MBL fold metallo-hydrolase [Pseudaestuariivita atlantica]|uniref:Metallo-beta-lactamase domain-containing protein n=1 Tax=Pseudaestuariivita atlantica TaxID=1317121 RepID=A0A0L1JSP5_9RHOB|nr:MBL fold metallo-hydrolase [Pseudaestuariivita atlantica]KNG94408.1 hypothetical protein ATO11_06660 [Pseudaestuariivita atlantica]
MFPSPRLSRRAFGMAALTAPLAVSFAGQARADGHAAPGDAAIYGASLGSYRITAIMDGVAPLGRGFFFGLPDEQINSVMEANGIGPDLLPAPVNAYLLQSGDRTILIDAGMGGLEMLGPGFGRLSAGLAAAGTSAEAVDTVVVTHLHPDHVGGLLAGGGAAFANAELVVAEAEATFWTDDAAMAAAPEAMQGLFQLAKAVMGAYAGRVTQVADGAEIAPGLTLSLSPGHTPGHSVVMIDGGDRQVMMVADTIHNAELHTALPNIGFGFDVDTGLAAQSRVALFDRLAADKTLIAGSHVHFPGFGRILRDGEVYRYVPATWA